MKRTTCRRFSEENVYNMGLMAELTGSTNTITQAYTSPEITVPLREARPSRKVLNNYFPYFNPLNKIHTLYDVHISHGTLSNLLQGRFLFNYDIYF